MARLTLLIPIHSILCQKSNRRPFGPFHLHQTPHNQRQDLEMRSGACGSPALKPPWLPTPAGRPGATSAPAIRTSWPGRDGTKLVPASGPLHSLFPLLPMLFPWPETEARRGQVTGPKVTQLGSGGARMHRAARLRPHTGLPFL